MLLAHQAGLEYHGWMFASNNLEDTLLKQKIYGMDKILFPLE
jgi:hypothetical protein